MADRIIQLKDENDNNVYPVSFNNGSNIKITDIQSIINNLKDKLYPIGTIYMTTENINPSTIFGGTWERIKDRFLLGCSNTYVSGSTGGEATHTISINEMPSHTHTIGIDRDGGWGSYRCPYGSSYSVRTSYTGGGQSHENMPPYLCVYTWKRVS